MGWNRRVLISFTFLTAASGGAQEAPGEKAKVIFERVCGTCHKPEIALSTRRSKDQWQETMDSMVVKGLKAPEEQLTLVFEYLVGRYGRVNVNRATASALTEILGLSAKEAEAIVKYRKENGKFEDFDTLANVPDVDLKKLAKNREAISF